MNILVVDDHPLMRLGVRQLILSEWPQALVAEATTLREAMESVRFTRFDVIVLDMTLPDSTGVEGLVRLLRVVDESPILMFSLHAEVSYAPRLIQLGAAGYVPKDLAGEELIVAVRRIVQGGRYVSAQVADQLLGLLTGKRPDQLPHEALTGQEMRVMLLIAAGHSPARIAETMHISVKTVGSYRARLLEKCGWKNNTELVKYCVQHALTDGS